MFHIWNNIFIHEMKFLFARGRWELLSELAKHPDAVFSVRELAERTRLPVATTWRAVKELAGYGLVRSATYRRRSEVRLNERSPTLREIQRLSLVRPHLLAFRAFRRKLLRLYPKLDIRLFGSVAKGQEGPFSDIDVLVIIGKSGYQRRRVDGAATKVALEVDDEFLLHVHPIIVKEAGAAERLGARQDL